MDKPTEVEIKEFWEWCGCRRCEVEPGTWVCPDRRRYTRCSGIQAGMRKVVEEIIKDKNIPVRYSHNSTCYDCMERIKEKYIGKPNSRSGELKDKLNG